MPSDKDKPHVGARVSTGRRVIAGVAHSDTGTITRLEDGGYCVVQWDSDAESTSVLMMSLRPLADNGYSEGFDDAARVARLLNSVTTATPTPETSITVESCLAELSEMFPDTWLSVEVSWKPVIGAYYFIRIYGQPKQIEATATLDEAMAHIRAWRESQ